MPCELLYTCYLLTYLVSATFKYDELEVENVNRG